MATQEQEKLKHPTLSNPVTPEEYSQLLAYLDQQSRIYEEERERKNKARTRVRRLTKQIEGHEAKLIKLRKELSDTFYNDDIFGFMERSQIDSKLRVRKALAGRDY